MALWLLDAGPRGGTSWEELEAAVGGEDSAACIRAMVRANLLGYCPAMISSGKPEVGSVCVPVVRVASCSLLEVLPCLIGSGRGGAAERWGGVWDQDGAGAGRDGMTDGIT